MECPRCGSDQVGTVDKVLAMVGRDEDGQVYYLGETKLDSQYTIMDGSETLFGCLHCTHEWYARQEVRG